MSGLHRIFTRKLANKVADKVDQSEHREPILILFSVGVGALLLGVAIYNILTQATPDPVTRWIGIIICLLLGSLFFFSGITLWRQTRKKTK